MLLVAVMFPNYICCNLNPYCDDGILDMGSWEVIGVR
jgi:hypothetical protein